LAIKNDIIGGTALPIWAKHAPLLPEKIKSDEDE